MNHTTASSHKTGCSAGFTLALTLGILLFTGGEQASRGEQPNTTAHTEKAMTANANAPDAAYRNPALPVEERVKDLLGRMILEEKAAQMQGSWGQKARLLDEEGRFDREKAKASFADGRGLGQIARPAETKKALTPRQTAEMTNIIQKFFREESRLGIPVIFHDECLHGLMANEATSFPQAIGLAATFDPELIERIFTLTALETRVRGAHQALSPLMDVARDPRWGRTEETYGEDPYLAARIGVAAVRGMQGDGSFTDKRHIIATLKHFAAHGGPESGTNCAPVNVSERILREVYLYSFRKGVQEGGAISVMASYNEIDGVPSHANTWLLRDVLRKEWNFDGYIVSDYDGIAQLFSRGGLFGHHVAKDPKHAAELAVRAGVNIELPDIDCYAYLVELVREGTLSETQLDELVAPMLAWKFKLGLFEDPYVDPDKAEAIVGCQEHRQLALEAAQKTITLLKNDGDIVPLDKAKIKTLAVIGPNADRVLLGGYSAWPKQTITLLQGIRDYVGDAVEVLHHPGCPITQGQSWYADEVKLGDPQEDRRLIAEAMDMAQKADAIVLALGGNEQTCREAWSRKHLGDRASLDLIGRQDELVDAAVATGKPVIVFLFHGRPNSITNVAQKANAIFECWYLGQEAGRAAAEVLFGKVNPGGKLPITIPRSAGHLPAYYNYKPSARRGYLLDDVGPLFAFGYGLSYTRFTFSNVRLEKNSIALGETTRVLVDVANTGAMAGDEVVQMYIRDHFSSVTRPVKELKGFQRITLEPGQSQTVALDITPESLAFYNIDMDYVVEPGEFTIMVGNSSRDEDLQPVTLTVQTP